jgi:adsorption protein B
MGADTAFWLLDRAVQELVIFAAAFIFVGGIDDLATDMIWIARTVWRRVFIYSVHHRADAATLAPPPEPGRIVVFVPAWREAKVIGRMLETATERFGAGDWRIYIGCYPNDPASIDTVARVAATEPRVRLVVGPRPGPTTKADNLNRMWAAMARDEAREGVMAKAIVLHDAEDVVHPAELRLFDTLSDRFDLIQLPVLPLIATGGGFWSRFISGHYADEFAEAHGKMLVVREAIGAAIPSAGVGCAFSRRALARIALLRNGRPFESASVTEDYELGLTIAAMGGRGIFVRLPGKRGGAAVAVRAHFPESWEAAIRQKARWMAGIALDGWDRLGWSGGLAERWMRLRDRRSVLAAIVLFAAYAGAAGWLVLHAFAPSDYDFVRYGPATNAMLVATTILLGWRLAMRFAFVSYAYGVREGLKAIPRVVAANIIAMLAARRAMARYLARLRGATVVWDKTDHIFPDRVPAE